MANPNDISKKEAFKKEEENDPVKAGKKAIEADKKINKQDKPEHEKEKEEKEDAEKWRNEG